MSDADTKRIAEEAAEQAVERVLQRLGFDTEDPKALQADQTYLRSQREISQKVTLSVRIFIITTFISGVVGMAWMGVKKVLGEN
ncbi:hypothetical protein [Endozoicomonas lisbonensis]|uniref:DUF1640 domain-containing protein n=1 Tax=Endozoicomonas lisbonensis TaxID=3120522 RepID=A0ABV2SGW1_9GAMM